jgi:hypothetical protein
MSRSEESLCDPDPKGHVTSADRTPGKVTMIDSTAKIDPGALEKNVRTRIKKLIKTLDHPARGCRNGPVERTNQGEYCSYEEENTSC